jgi:hypothetical protein
VYQYALQKTVIDFCDEVAVNSQGSATLLMNFDPEMVMLSLSKKHRKLAIVDGQHLRSDNDGLFIIPFFENKWWKLFVDPTE